MNKITRLAILAFLIILPVVWYFSNTVTPERHNITRVRFVKAVPPVTPQKTHPHIQNKAITVALIFDDLGESLQDIQKISSLDVPVSVAIIPGLRFSQSIAYMAQRSGMSVITHIPMKPKHGELYRTPKYRFIEPGMRTRQLHSLLDYYLGYIKISVGANNHMGSLATEDPNVMRALMRKLKKRNMFFVDSRTTPGSIACHIAAQESVPCVENAGFMDATDDEKKISERLDRFIERVPEQGKIVLIAHPHKKTFAVLQKKIPGLKHSVQFVSLEEFFKQ